MKMTNREEIKEEAARYFFDEKARVSPGISLTLFFIALYLTITYPFWLIRTNMMKGSEKKDKNKK